MKGKHCAPLVFEKATDEATRSEMYARMRWKMMEQISLLNVHDNGIRIADGKPIAGGRLFCKYPLNRCQEDFERGWVAKEPIAAPAETKASEDQAAKVTAEQSKDGESALSPGLERVLRRAEGKASGLRSHQILQ
ncbi:hypothetical protein LXA43DRAFT_1135457 [Ganoderma leucocontextum]|nr:hypothetical protein LXA43DRAFT_1135457 [Ganoderma leucocontextum]